MATAKALNTLPLMAHHRDLERSFLRALGHIHSQDQLEARAAWLLFERELSEHFFAEEQELIPGFRRSFPDDAAEICLEHRQLRERLGELAIMLDLQTLRHEDAMAFVVSLRDHADKEATLFYQWAGQHLPAGRSQELGARLESLSRQVAEALREAPVRD
jgi:hemerythrin-like domain-containing protein